MRVSFCFRCRWLDKNGKIWYNASDGFIPIDRLRLFGAFEFEFETFGFPAGRLAGMTKVTFFVLIYILY